MHAPAATHEPGRLLIALMALSTLAAVIVGATDIKAVAREAPASPVVMERTAQDDGAGYIP